MLFLIRPKREATWFQLYQGYRKIDETIIPATFLLPLSPAAFVLPR
jgi:hypothetical protein